MVKDMDWCLSEPLIFKYLHYWENILAAANTTCKWCCVHSVVLFYQQAEHSLTSSALIRGMVKLATRCSPNLTWRSTKHNASKLISYCTNTENDSSNTVVTVINNCLFNEFRNAFIALNLNQTLWAVSILQPQILYQRSRSLRVLHTIFLFLWDNDLLGNDLGSRSWDLFELLAQFGQYLLIYRHVFSEYYKLFI